eukprot:scaffold13657_cov109-Isochrysis_galbana.AAC.3
MTNDVTINSSPVDGYLFDWGPHRLDLPQFEITPTTGGAPVINSAAAEPEEVNLDVEKEEGDRNAFTEEYIRGG